MLTLGSSAESVVGMLRDGEVHHETSAVALQHAAGSAGEHGHEDVAPSDDEHQNGRHAHGTAGDHCTHTHSEALFPASALALPAQESTVDFIEPSVRLARTFSSPFHPPKA